MLLYLMLACTTKADSSNDSEPCPMLDCGDALTLNVLRVSGDPAGFFEFWVRTDETELRGSCNSVPESFEGAICDGAGTVDLFIYGETIDVTVSEGDDGASWGGTLTPEWTAPYDSEACGHYCYLSEATVQLEPCDGCG